MDEEVVVFPVSEEVFIYIEASANNYCTVEEFLEAMLGFVFSIFNSDTEEDIIDFEGYFFESMDTWLMNEVYKNDMESYYKIDYRGERLLIEWVYGVIEILRGNKVSNYTIIGNIITLYIKEIYV